MYLGRCVYTTGLWHLIPTWTYTQQLRGGYNNYWYGYCRFEMLITRWCSYVFSSGKFDVFVARGDKEPKLVRQVCLHSIIALSWICTPPNKCHWIVDNEWHGIHRNVVIWIHLYTSCRYSIITMRVALENWLLCTILRGQFHVLHQTLPIYQIRTHTLFSRAATVVATSTGILWALVSACPPFT